MSAVFKAEAKNLGGNRVILLFDVGNTNIKLAVFSDEGKALHVARFKTDREKTEDEYAVLIHDIARLNGFDCKAFDGAVISCVAPSITPLLVEAVRRVCGCECLVVGAGVKTGLDIRIDDPGSLGSDMCASAVGAIEYYGAPAVIISVGTATTITAVNKKKTLLGGFIMTGIDISLAALAHKTDSLPYITLDKPNKAISANTRDCMNAGVIFGHAGAIDGVLRRFERELGCKPTVIATGGRAKDIIPYCEADIILDKELILKGLYSIYRKNRR